LPGVGVERTRWKSGAIHIYDFALIAKPVSGQHGIRTVLTCRAGAVPEPFDQDYENGPVVLLDECPEGKVAEAVRRTADPDAAEQPLKRFACGRTPRLITQ
jgi:hypothetical protein